MERENEQLCSASHRFGFSSSTLKMIAVVTMLVDHIAAVLIIKFLIHEGVLDLITYNGVRYLSILSPDNAGLLDIYQIMRSIGRIAFPIYCFVLVEGFMRTGNLQKYLGRMFLFALLSEIPFDLAFAGKILYWDYQNVMFTLFLGLLAMYVSQMAEDRVALKIEKWILLLFIWLGAAQAAEWICADYGAKGILCIGVLYLLRYAKRLQLLGGAAAFLWELPAPAAFLFIAMYNGKRGNSFKHFFYAFYPVHLLLLYLISMIFGMAGVAVV